MFQTENIDAKPKIEMDNNIKMDPKEMGFGGAYRIQLF
jgi:hypothetical protein